LSCASDLCFVLLTCVLFYGQIVLIESLGVE
jgi:hypothetical protein